MPTPSRSRLARSHRASLRLAVPWAVLLAVVATGCARGGRGRGSPGADAGSDARPSQDGGWGEDAGRPDTGRTDAGPGEDGSVPPTPDAGGGEEGGLDGAPDGGGGCPASPVAPWDGAPPCTAAYVACLSACPAGDAACRDRCDAAEDRNCAVCQARELLACANAAGCQAQWDCFVACREASGCVGADGSVDSACVERECGVELMAYDACFGGEAGRACHWGDCVAGRTASCRLDVVMRWNGAPPCTAALLSCAGACAPGDSACVQGCVDREPPDCSRCLSVESVSCANRNGCQGQWDCYTTCARDRCTGADGTIDQGCVDAMCASEQAAYRSCRDALPSDTCNVDACLPPGA